MILSPILQPSPTKVCHVPMTSQWYISPQLEPCTGISKEIKREKYIYVFIDSTEKWCKGPMMTNIHHLYNKVTSPPYKEKKPNVKY